jgi:hypothetical protein
MSCARGGFVSCELGPIWCSDGLASTCFHCTIIGSCPPPTFWSSCFLFPPSLASGGEKYTSCQSSLHVQLGVVGHRRAFAYDMHLAVLKNARAKHVTHRVVAHSLMTHHFDLCLLDYLTGSAWRFQS